MTYQRFLGSGVGQRREVRLEINGERNRRAGREPLNASRENFRPRVGPRRSLNRSRIQIDHPVLGHLLVAIEHSFDDAIGTRRRRRQHFDGEQQALDVVKMLGSTPGNEWYDEQVWLNPSLRRQSIVS
jgi:hypothetical protein